MQINKVKAVYFSAAGNTERVVLRIAERTAALLGVPLERLDFTLPAAREELQTFGPEELAVVGTPTYAGKVPNKLLPYVQEKLKANGALAVPVVTFGNRSFDNSLAELAFTLEQNGFHTVAAGAFVMPHVFSDKLAQDHPNGEDEAMMEQVAQAAAKAAQAEEVPAPVSVSGAADAPYYTPRGVDGKPAVFLKAKPKTTEACDDCGICVKACPMGSIQAEDPREVKGICIKCQACVKKCPKGAKYFDDPAFLSHVAMLEQNYARPTVSTVFF